MIYTKNRINRYRTGKPISLKPGGRVTVATTPHTLFMAHLMCNELSAAGYCAEVVIGLPRKGFERHLHFVICPQMFRKLPHSYFAVQMEQSVSSRWFDKTYINKLSKALAILDYNKKNIEYLLGKGLHYSKIYYVPVSFFRNYRDYIGLTSTSIHKDQKPYDVVFYGDTNNPRRTEILGEIGKHFKLLLINNVFSVDLYKQLLSARVVVNIHYYENALLETTRIFESLSLGLPVVSEKGTDHADHENLHEVVDFVEVGDIPALLKSIRRVLDSPAAGEATIENAMEKTWESKQFSFYFNRVLLAFDLVNFEYFKNRLNDYPYDQDSFKCLTLTETIDRRAAFRKKHQDRFTLVDGLRHKIGWVGCALSYKFYAGQAIRAGAQQLLMCEDDVFLPTGYEDDLNVVMRYLKGQDTSWDVFSGIIAHLNEDAKILKVDVFEGIEFVTLDRMTSMVFNIYSPKALQLIEAWDELDKSPEYNTIDRFLENAGLRVITTLPFLVGHDDEVSSTLWGFSNGEYIPLINTSETLLRKKVADYKKQFTRRYV